MHEGIPILNYLVPKEFTHEDGRLTGVVFEKVEAQYDDKGRRRLVPTGEPDQFISTATTCWSPSARRTPSPGSSATSGIEFDEWGMPVVDQHDIPVDAARRCSSAATPRSARRTSSGRSPTATRRRSRSTALPRRGRHRPAAAARDAAPARRWASTSGATTTTSRSIDRYKVPLRDQKIALADIKAEVELGFDALARLRGDAALPELRRADGVHRHAVHRVRRLRRHLPDGLHHLHRQRPEDELRAAAERAGPDLEPGPLRLRRRSRPAGSWPRTRTSACTAACAPSAARPAPGTCRSSCSTWHRLPATPDATDERQSLPATSGVNDFVVKFANVNGSGLGERQRAVRPLDPAHGRAGRLAQHLPVQHPGPADLVRGARLARPAISAGAAAST